AAVIFATAASTPAAGPADAGRFLANTGLPASAFDLSFPALGFSFTAPTVRRFSPDCPEEIPPHSSAASLPTAPHPDQSNCHRHTPPVTHPPAPPPPQPHRHRHPQHASSARSASSLAEAYAPRATAETLSNGRRSASRPSRNR